MFPTDVKTQNPLKAYCLKQTHMHTLRPFIFLFSLMHTKQLWTIEVLLTDLKDKDKGKVFKFIFDRVILLLKSSE